ncbi:WhiB family transcriptional regulator [Candidatus Saccharibacteria bacterium]|nr:WhiB family transcriptional regulator [Candidatus Saccharibacteria bacterium]MDQ5884982.1 WhiB family transcriptional regulator, redox-sensing transcriptional regulator [Patescibacteria group bacterium]MDQ5958575.1 WhiB family transcriptional regulator, redox-sensing transcriptional regulator [Patescibacteria group bacterium]
MVNKPNSRNKDSWMLKGLCGQTDPEAFFPENGSSTEQAKKVCGECAVRLECLEYALENDEKGVWGATTDNERDRMKKGNL